MQLSPTPAQLVPDTSIDRNSGTVPAVTGIPTTWDPGYPVTTTFHVDMPNPTATDSLNILNPIAGYDGIVTHEGDLGGVGPSGPIGHSGDLGGVNG